jgi:bacillithiol biosynthesis deacetylase BshB1
MTDDRKIDILAFGAHPDDVEIGIAGTLIKHIQNGYKAGVIDLTRGELGSRGTPEIRAREAEVASQMLGISLRENLLMRDGFIDMSEVNKLKVIDAIRRYRPKVILAPYEQDRHPDHGNCGRLVRECCFLSGLKKIETASPPHKVNQIFFYFLAWEFEFSFIVDISEQFPRKMEAIKSFQSQFYYPEDIDTPTLLSHPDFLQWIENRARYYGNRIGAHYGEPFYSSGVMKANDLIKMQIGPLTI